MFPRLTQDRDFSTSVSGASGITGVYHNPWLKVLEFDKFQVF
jgi:hypothetical protein